MVGLKTNKVGVSSLEALFATPTLARLLAVFALEPERRFYQKELVMTSGSSLYLVQRELKRLEAAGLISRTPRGRQVEYVANTVHPAFAGLRDALLNTIAMADRLRSVFQSLEGARLVFIFGSIARGDEDPDSDIDLLVIGDLGLREVATRVVPAFRDAGREPNIVVLTEAEMSERLRVGDSFLATVLGEPKIWIIGDEGELAELVG
jgi:predicted nucleotidyltransferase